jgi:hypothetical protein
MKKKYKGVDFFKRNGRYRARASVNGDVYFLGYFETAELASEAYETFTKREKKAA